MFNVVKRCVTILFLCALAFLFIAPSRYLGRLADDLMLEAEAARTAVAEDADPAPHLSRMRTRMEEASDTLRLFLDHASVDEAMAAIAACEPLREREALLSALTTVQTTLSHLKNIELFHFHTLF